MKAGLRTKLEYDDLASIPPDGKRYELLDGDLRVTASPNREHQRTVGRLFRMLEDQLPEPLEVWLSPFDVILSKNDVVVPDLIVVRDPNQVSQRGVETAPFLVVEVLSPSTRRFDQTVKARFYATHGIEHYWMVDPNKQRVECFSRDGETYRLAASCDKAEPFVHPDFSGFSLAGLWG